MVTLAQKRAAEQDFRALLDDHGLPQPDAVEYGCECVRLFWNEERLCVIVDIDNHGGRMTLEDVPAADVEVCLQEVVEPSPEPAAQPSPMADVLAFPAASRHRRHG